MKKFVFGAGATAIIGAAAGIIYSHECKRKERKDMSDKMIDNVKSIDEAVQNKADHAKDVSADTANKASQTIKEMKNKKETMKRDMAAGYRKVKKDIHKTNSKISKDLKSL